MLSLRFPFTVKQLMSLWAWIVSIAGAVGVDCLDCCFPLNGRGAIVGSLWTANDFIAFALVVSVWPLAVF